MTDAELDKLTQDINTAKAALEVALFNLTRCLLPYDGDRNLAEQLLMFTEEKDLAEAMLALADPIELDGPLSQADLDAVKADLSAGVAAHQTLSSLLDRRENHARATAPNKPVVFHALGREFFFDHATGQPRYIHSDLVHERLVEDLVDPAKDIEDPRRILNPTARI